MDLRDIAVLVEAVQAGSLAAAGRRLGITPMAASRRLASLEAELGVRLAHRSTRSLSLTPEGEAFLPHAQAMLSQEADGRAAVRPPDGGAWGLLRVTASVPFGRKIVTPMLAQFMRAHPELRVELLLSDSVLDIAAQGIDVAIRIATLHDSSLIARKLADNPSALCASPAYVAAHGMPAVLGDLALHQCLALPGTTHWNFMRSGKPVQQRVSARFAADSIDALHQACLEGLGIARIAVWNVKEDVAEERLVTIDLADAVLPKQAIWAVYPSARFVSAKVRLFVDAFRRHLHSP